MDLLAIAAGLNFEHSKQVARISGILALRLGFSQAESQLITQAAAYHDIGKIAIPRQILNKPGALTPEEFELVKTHTDIGCKQLSEAAEVLSLAAEIAHYHHEKMNGFGSYHGFTGAEIHPYIRLVTVADVFDALISKRAYKDSWDEKTVCEYFKEQAGKQFDTDIVSALLSIIDEILLLYKKENEPL